MKLHRNEKYFKWGLTAFLLFVACAVFWIVFSNLPGFYGMILDFFGIISPILFGCLFAYLMNPIMERIRAVAERLLRKRGVGDKRAELIAKIIGLVLALLVFIGGVFALFMLFVPNLIGSIEELLQPEKLEGYYNRINDWANHLLSGTRVGGWVRENLDNLLQMLTDLLKKIDLSALITGITSSVYSVVMFVFDLLVGVVAAVYLLLYKQKLTAQAKKITVAVFNTNHANRIFEIARRTNRIFSGYLIGKIIDALIVGVITYFALTIMGMPYAPLIAAIVGVTNVIPFFGPFLGAVPSALLLLIERPINALYFILFILVLQMIDGNIIENRILGEKLGISDFWVLTSILIFGGIFGFGGMLLGVPIFAVLYTVIADRVNDRLKRKRYPLQTDAYYSLQCVEDLPVDPLPSYSSASVEPAYDLHFESEDDEYGYDDDD